MWGGGFEGWAGVRGEGEDEGRWRKDVLDMEEGRGLALPLLSFTHLLVLVQSIATLHLSYTYAACIVAQHPYPDQRLPLLGTCALVQEHMGMLAL